MKTNTLSQGLNSQDVCPCSLCLITHTIMHTHACTHPHTYTHTCAYPHSCMHLCGGQRTRCVNWFSASTLWVARTELKSSVWQQTPLFTKRSCRPHMSGFESCIFFIGFLHIFLLSLKMPNLQHYTFTILHLLHSLYSFPGPQAQCQAASSFGLASTSTLTSPNVT